MSAGATHAADGFFALRTPLLPLAEWLRWSDGLRAPGAQGESDLTKALGLDLRELRARLRLWVERPEIRDAIFVASPDLEASLPLWLAQPESERGQKVERALVRYFARMSSRPTPFGLFAGCSVGSVGRETRLAVSGRAAYQRHTRLDMDYLFALAETLGKDPALRAELKYRPNTSLYRAAGRLRYAEARLNGKTRTHHLVAVEPADYLVETLARAQAGATLPELARALVKDDISHEEAEAFIGQLIEGQLLESDLAPAVTGEEPVHGMIALLRGTKAGSATAKLLEQARTALTGIDSAGLGLPPSRYRDVAASLQALPAKVELPRLFQVDLMKPAPEATLGQDVVAEVWRGIEALHRLAGAPSEAMDRFRDAFALRYEGAEVPLLEALDDEAGIGFQAVSGASGDASPLLAGLNFPAARAPGAALRPEVASLLLGKLDHAVRTGVLEIELTEQDVESVERSDAPPLPDALAALGTVLATPEQLARGELLFELEGVAGPSGARLLGRFCHGDPELRRRVEAHARAEEALRPDAVFAEVVHLPEGRVGNILARPVLRGHELAYLGHSGAADEARLPMADLRLRLEGGRVVLRSAKLGREVIPRLSSAHFYGPHSLGVYRFLCALQDQGVASQLGWSWGALERAPFLPRVRLGRVVLARARWRLEKPELERLGRLRGAALLEELRRVREHLRIPRRVAVAEADNVLPLDLENALCLETFTQLMKGKDSVLIEEQSDVEALCAHGPEGAFTHEVVVPFVRRPVEAARAATPARLESKVQRVFPPGSAWLYAKLYTGSASADVLLRDHIGPLIRRAMASGAAERWFFLRYGDPGWHLRLRFAGSPARLNAEVLPALGAMAEPLLREGLLLRLGFDTYDREVERYGGDEGVVLAEQLFHADSEAVLELLGMLSGDEGADARWRLALRGCDLLLSDLGLDLEARLKLMRGVREAFAREHRAERTLEDQLSAKFRKERPALEALLWRADASHALWPGLEVFQKRSHTIAPVVSELARLSREGRLTESLESLGGSLMHMHVNRLLRASHRAQELVVYDFLMRLYESRIARERKAPSSN